MKTRLIALSTRTTEVSHIENSETDAGEFLPGGLYSCPVAGVVDVEDPRHLEILTRDHGFAIAGLVGSSAERRALKAEPGVHFIDLDLRLVLTSDGDHWVDVVAGQMVH